MRNELKFTTLHCHNTYSGADSIGHGGHVPPTFTNGWAWGLRE